jgi:nucleoid-associated protein YgaU
MKTIEILQPKPYDLVDYNIMIAGNASAFEGTLSIYVSDGHFEFKTIANAGAMGLRQFQCVVEIPKDIEFKLDRLLITATDDTALDPGDPNIPVAQVPILFGPKILNNYSNYWLYKVKKGDSLYSIADEFYENSSMWEVIYRANIESISNPDLIFAGQLLKIPRAF